MNKRQAILAGLAVLMTASYAYHKAHVDTVEKASLRFGRAITHSDVHTLWGFVRQEEREFYNLDEAKFAAYWNTFIKPKFQHFDGFNIQSSNSNGLVVRAFDSRQTMPGHYADWQISGQLGSYYVPVFISSAMFKAAIYDPNDMRPRKEVKYSHCKKWIDENMAALQAFGFGTIQRGPGFRPKETLAYFREWVERARLDAIKTESMPKLATRSR